MGTGPGSLAAYFDDWYASMVGSPRKDEIAQRHLGLPPHLLSTSLLTWDGIAEVTHALQLSPGDTLLDLACGRGGSGLEIAARTGARLLGVDVSAEAVRQATALAGASSSASFLVGDLAATGLPDGAASAVLCVDAVQFAADQDAACRELRRVVRPGGRVVLTCWEALDRGDEAVPQRLRDVDLAAGLATAGFSDVEVVERPAWREAERRMWQEAASLDPAGDPALQSVADEGVRSLQHFDAVRRVLATATAPA